MLERCDSILSVRIRALLENRPDSNAGACDCGWAVTSRNTPLAALQVSHSGTSKPTLHSSITVVFAGSKFIRFTALRLSVEG